MYYKCRKCEYEEARGFLPTVTCGMLLFLQMGCVVGIAVIVAHMIRDGGPREPVDLGWWNLLVVPSMLVVGLVGAFLGALVLHAILELKVCLKTSARFSNPLSQALSRSGEREREVGFDTRSYGHTWAHHHPPALCFPRAGYCFPCRRGTSRPGRAAAGGALPDVVPFTTRDSMVREVSRARVRLSGKLGLHPRYPAKHATDIPHIVVGTAFQTDV